MAKATKTTKTTKTTKAVKAVKATPKKRGEHLKSMKVNRGRKKGVRKVVSKDFVDGLKDQYTSLSAMFDEFSLNLENFTDRNVASSVAKARKNLQSMILMQKTIRKTIQEAKSSMVEEEI